MNEDRIQTASEYLAEGQITGEIIGVFFNVYNALGFGFLESVYRRAMRDDLLARGLDVKEECPVSVKYNGRDSATFGSIYSWKIALPSSSRPPCFSARRTSDS